MAGGECEVDDSATHCATLLKHVLQDWIKWLRQGWQEGGGLLAMATFAYGDAGAAEGEQWFTRGACAELLVDADAVVTKEVCEGLFLSRAWGCCNCFGAAACYRANSSFLPRSAISTPFELMRGRGSTSHRADAVRQGPAHLDDGSPHSDRRSPRAKRGPGSRDAGRLASRYRNILASPKFL
jgi:hypothetical protein